MEPVPLLAGKVCVVNGAASVIGRAVAERFASEGALEKRLVHWPMGRFGTLAEAAGTIAFLASDDSGFITAAALPLDGGITEAFTVPE
jgi:NAD(P)-dependent dehydrogenase (short-subunit alcohol dehydrogenase family)